MEQHAVTEIQNEQPTGYQNPNQNVFPHRTTSLERHFWNPEHIQQEQHPENNRSYDETGPNHCAIHRPTPSSTDFNFSS